MAGVDSPVIIVVNECLDDLPDEGFDQGDCSSPSSTANNSNVPCEEALTLCQKIEAYLRSDDYIVRHLVPSMIRDMFRNDSPVTLSKELPNLMTEFLKMDYDSAVLADILKLLPDIAAEAIQNANRVDCLKNVIVDYLIPLAVRNLGSFDASCDRAAHTALIAMIERGFISKFQAEIQVCPSILALSKMDNQRDINTGAIILMSKLAAILGKDITERIFLKTFSDLCASSAFNVRKVSAAHIGYFAAVVGKSAFENILMPCYLSLCLDAIWGVRKSCAEVAVFMSLICTMEQRTTILTPYFLNLLHDDCRWVRLAAYQSLGAFIVTFANPPLISVRTNNSGDLILVNMKGDEYRISDLEIANPTTPNAMELSFFNVMEPSQTFQCSGADDDDDGGGGGGGGNIGGNFNSRRLVTDLDEIGGAPNVTINPTDGVPVIHNSIVIENSNNKTIEMKDEVEDKLLKSINNDEQCDEDQLLYNQFNYWHINPPIIESNDLAKFVDIVEPENNKADSTQITYDMVTQLTNEYSSIHLSDNNNSNTAIDSTCKSLDTPSASDINSDINIKSNISDSNSDSNATNVTVSISPPPPPLPPLIRVISDLYPPQHIVPQELIDCFISMTNVIETHFNDIQMAYYCAYTLPAVILTLGRDNWWFIKDTLHILAGHMSYKIRRTIAGCLHEIAAILGPEMTAEHLAPIFEGFLLDLDEVRIEILKHLAFFFGLIKFEIRMKYLPKLGQLLKIDNVCNWRFQETFAEQLKLCVRLFEAEDIVKYIGTYAQALLVHNVAAVRHAAMLLVTEIVKTIAFDQSRTANYVSMLAERFAHSKKWKSRQTFALLCTELLAGNALEPEEFVSLVFPILWDLSWDSIANVRIVVCRCIVQRIITNEYFRTEHRETLENVLGRLQADKDRDVRLFACNT